MVWHSPFLLQTVAEIPGHPFSALPLLNNCALLSQLKDLVTLDPVGHIKNATGIPPHIEQALLTRQVLDTCIATVNQVQTMTQDVKVAIGEAIEQKAIDNGQLTFERLRGMFDAHSLNMERKIGEAINKLTETFAGRTAGEEDESNNDEIPVADGGKEENIVVVRNGQSHTYKTFSYCYDGKLGWHVPKVFQFPARCKLDLGWKLWLKGLPDNQVTGPDGSLQAAPIRPFRKLNPAFLPAKVKQTFTLHWKPIFELLEKAPDLTIVENPEDLDAAVIDESFAKAKEYLKTRVQYVFQKQRSHPDSWEISTWAKYVSKSFIL